MRAIVARRLGVVGETPLESTNHRHRKLTALPKMMLVYRCVSFICTAEWVEWQRFTVCHVCEL